MKISVIIPNYNHEIFLEERIKSVLNNIQSEDEIIFLDDNSTDGSVILAKELLRNHKNVVYMLNKKNSGNPAIQWKRGIKLASNELIWIAESDDTADIEMISILRKKFDDVEDLQFAFCQSNILSSNNMLSFDLIDEQKNIGLLVSTLYSGHEFVDSFLKKRNYVFNASACLFKKSDLNIENMKYIFDWLFWIQNATLGKVWYEASPLNYFRSHPQTTRVFLSSKNELKKYIQYNFLINKILDLGFKINHSDYRWMIKELYPKKAKMNLLYYLIKLLPLVRNIEKCV